MNTTALNTGATLIPACHSSLWPSWFCWDTIKKISRLALPILAVSWGIPGARGVNITSLEQMRTDENGFELVALKSQTGFGQWIIRLGGNMEDFRLNQTDFRRLAKWETDFFWIDKELDPAKDDMMDKTCLTTWQNLEGRYLRVDKVNNSTLPEYPIFMATPPEVSLYLKANNPPLYELVGDNWDETLSSDRRGRRSEEQFGMMHMLSVTEYKARRTKCSSPVYTYWEGRVEEARKNFSRYWDSKGVFWGMVTSLEQNKIIRELENQLDNVGKPWARQKSPFNISPETRSIETIIKNYVDLLNFRIKNQLDAVLLSMMEGGELFFHLPTHKQSASIIEKSLLDKNHPKGIHQTTCGVFLNDSLGNLTLYLNIFGDKTRGLEEVPYERGSLKRFSSWIRWVDTIGHITGGAASIVASINILRTTGYLVTKIREISRG